MRLAEGLRGMAETAEPLDERITSVRFIARLGSAMLGADYPVHLIGRTLDGIPTGTELTVRCWCYRISSKRAIAI